MGYVTWVYLSHGKDEVAVKVEVERTSYEVLEADGCDYETSEIYEIVDIDVLGLRPELNHKVAEIRLELEEKRYFDDDGPIDGMGLAKSQREWEEFSNN
jgi:hypothetical protein